ncbi:MAG: hypothetical protein A2V83_10775 [Nitrospirae bacterium RBG_16_64_22]|nr:MAG: hypothetical protein A2V83_10775 [Nitrospirae bacterium RBG_16_64_22]
MMGSRGEPIYSALPDRETFRLRARGARVLSAKELRGILAGTDALRDLEMEHHLEVAEDEKGS